MHTTALKKGKCFSCGKTGHWASECPTKKSTGSFSHPNLNASGVASLGYPEIICRCGAGACITRVAKESGEVYYKCPAESWMSCGFFMRRNKCDSRGVRRLEYPICECGAGVCELGREATTGREYFKCRVPKGQGACSFRQWVDEPVSYKKSITLEEADYLSTPQKLGKQTNHFEDNDSPRKCLRITELDGSLNTNSGHSSSNSAASFVSSDTKEESSVIIDLELDDISPEILSKIMENDYPLSEDDESSCKLRKTPESVENTVSLSLSPSAQLSSYTAVSWGSSNAKEIPMQIETDLQEFDTDEDFINEVIAIESQMEERAKLSYDFQMEEVVDTATKLPDYETVQPFQANFERRIVAAATDHPQEKCLSVMLGAQYLDWLSRLAFASHRCLTLLLDKRWFYCMFPNFDPIYAPQGIGQFEFDKGAQTVSNSTVDKSLTVPRESFVEDVPATILKEPYTPGSPPNVAEPDNVIAVAILEAFGQAAVLIQTNFITRLESMNPSSHESMTKEANTAFASLDHLKIDYRPFHQRVKDFIDAAASLNQIEHSVCNDALYEDTLNRLNNAKLHLEQLSSEHSSVMKSFTCSQERVESLLNETEEVRNRLLQIEQQVASCQVETNDLSIQLAELSDQINECQNNLQSAMLEAEAVQKLSLQKEAARGTYEKAKFQLRNKDRAS